VPDLVLALDLGKMSDFSALTALKRRLVVDPRSGLPGRDPAGRPLYRFDCVLATRWPLRTGYPAVVGAVRGLLGRPEVARLRPHLAIDATGVGSAVVDMFFEKSLEAEGVALTVTAGDSVGRGPWSDGSHGHLRVPKPELVGALMACLEGDRLPIVPSLSEAPVIQAELLNFRARLTPKANQTYGAGAGTHDDLLMSLAMACWLGTSPFAEFRPGALGDADRHLLDSEGLAERAALARGLEAERIARINKRSCGMAAAFGGFW
jgi:hypothetical protein